MILGLRRLFAHRSLFSAHRVRAVVGIICATIEAALVIPVPWLVAHAIDAALPQHDRRLLALCALGVLVSTFGSVGLSVVAKSLLLSVTRGGTAQLRRHLMSRLVHASRQFHTDADESQLHDVLVTDAARVDQMASVLIGDVLPSLLMILGMIIALFIVNPTLTGVTALLVPLVVGTHAAFRRWRQRTLSAFHASYERFSSGVLRVLRTDELIRVDGTQCLVLHEQDARIRELEDRGRRSLLLDSAHDAAQLTSVSAVAAVILLVGGLLVINNKLQVGQLISFYAAFGLLRRPVAYLATSTGIVNAGSLALVNIDAFLDAEIRWRHPERDRERLVGEIETFLASGVRPAAAA